VVINLLQPEDFQLTETPFRSHTFFHQITLKHGCDLTDVLATRRFALLVKSLQWNRKIQCWNSC